MVVFSRCCWRLFVEVGGPSAHANLVSGHLQIIPTCPMSDELSLLGHHPDTLRCFDPNLRQFVGQQSTKKIAKFKPDQSCPFVMEWF